MDKQMAGTNNLWIYKHSLVIFEVRIHCTLQVFLLQIFYLLTKQEYVKFI